MRRMETTVPRDQYTIPTVFLQATDAPVEHEERDRRQRGRHPPHRGLQLVPLRLGQVRPTRDGGVSV